MLQWLVQSVFLRVHHKGQTVGRPCLPVDEIRYNVLPLRYCRCHGAAKVIAEQKASCCLDGSITPRPPLCREVVVTVQDTVGSKGQTNRVPAYLTSDRNGAGVVSTRNRYESE